MPSGEGIRIETGYGEGTTVPVYYDPMIAKIIASASTRDAAIEHLRRALAQTHIAGVKTNIPFLRRALDDAQFTSGHVHTGIAAELANHRT
jgi:acetyl-CoA carboxylase biotin carboxylase subunit